MGAKFNADSDSIVYTEFIVVWSEMRFAIYYRTIRFIKHERMIHSFVKETKLFLRNNLNALTRICVDPEAGLRQKANVLFGDRGL